MATNATIRTSQQLGAYVKALRKARGLTQSDVARMLGLTKMRVATIEKDIGRVSTASVIKLVHLLGGKLHLEVRGALDGPAREPETEPAEAPADSPSSKSPGSEHRSRGEW